jgi:tetratricopeptide (TPR) repeat protein
MVRINPKLLDVVRFASSSKEAGMQQGTIVQILGETPEAALVEVSDEQGVPVEFVRRALSELEQVPEGVEALEKTPQVPDAQLCFETGVLFLQNGQYNRAQAEFSKSFSLDPKFRGTLLNATLHLAGTGAFDAALGVLNILLELSPDYELARENLAITHMNRAITLARRGLFQQAMDGFLKGLAIHPSTATAERIRHNILATYTQLGLAYVSVHQHQFAYTCFQRAFELDQSETSRKNLSVAMIALSTVSAKNRSAATRAEIFREPLLMGLTLSECLGAYGATLATLNEVSEARDALEAAVEADPMNETARHNLHLITSNRSGEGIQAGFVAIELDAVLAA